jgi:acetate kinase
MSPQDAERHGVHDKDEVEVAISGGPRALIFGDLLVRVSPDFRTEMHIDTDEANAAELDGARLIGELVYSPASAVTAGIRSRRRS